MSATDHAEPKSKWETRKLKFLVERKDQKHNVELEGNDYLGLEHISSWTGKRLYDELTSCKGVCNLFHKGELLFGKLRPYLAKSYLAQENGYASTEFVVMSAKDEIIAKYLMYVTLSKVFIDAVNGGTYGVKMPRANWESIGSQPVRFPKPPTQQKIADFLDRKTAQIDTLIAKKRALIEKLKEKRLAVITQAVTRGLNPDAPFKDSGIEWLGKVPEHWEGRRLKFCVTYNDEVLPENTPPEQLLEYIDISSVSLEQGVTHVERVAFDDAPSRARRIVRDGDTIISTVRTYLKAIAPIKKPPVNTIVSTGFAVIRPTGIVESCYISHVIQSQGFVDQISANSMGVSYPAISPWKLTGITFAYPPSNQEQTKISKHIQTQTRKIDNIVNTQNKLIDRLTEYRTTLITAAVTRQLEIK